MASLTLDSDNSCLESLPNGQESAIDQGINGHRGDVTECQLHDDITDEELRITLISSVEEKMKIKLEEEVSKTQAEIQCLHHTNRELLDRQEDICKIGKDLDEKISNFSEYTKDLQSCESEIQLALNNLETNLKVSYLNFISRNCILVYVIFVLTITISVYIKLFFSLLQV